VKAAYCAAFFISGLGSSGLTPYFRCLARPQGQPPKVNIISIR
jgi:hypothetical protein